MFKLTERNHPAGIKSLMVAVAFFAFQSVFASGVQQELRDGVHQYRVTFSKKNVCDEGVITLLGCHHYVRLETLPKEQQSVLFDEVKKSDRLYNERTDEFINVKLRSYLNVMEKIASTPALLANNFFSNYTQKISKRSHPPLVHDQVIDYFVTIINSKLTPSFLDLINMHFEGDSLSKLKVLADAEIVQRLPERLVYDFTASYIKRTSLEYQMMDLLRTEKSDGHRVCALDLEPEMKESEQVLFGRTVDFSALMVENVRDAVLDFYSGYQWMFEEGSSFTAIPKELDRQIQVLCSISDDMKQRINQGVLFRKIQEDRNIQNCSVLMKIGLRQSVQSYTSGQFVLGSSEENAAERNYMWLQGPLVSATSVPRSFVEFGDAHLLSAGEDRGILNFFIDRLLNRDEDYWHAKLGAKAWLVWKSVEVTAVERLSETGEYHNAHKAVDK